MKLKLADDGSVLLSEDGTDAIDSMTPEEQTESIDSLAEEIAGDGLELEDQVEKVESNHLAAKNVLRENEINAKSKKSVNLTLAQRRMEAAIDSYNGFSDFLVRTLDRIKASRQAISKLNKAKSVNKSQLIKVISDVEAKARKLSAFSMRIGKEQTNLKKRYSYLFDHYDEVPTYGKDYSTYDFDENVKPRHDEESGDTITRTKEQRDDGWRKQEPGIALSQANKKRKRYSVDEQTSENLQSTDSEIPVPYPSDNMDIEDDTVSDVKELMAQSAMKEVETFMKKALKKRSLYNETDEYTMDAIDETIEDQAGEGDRQHTEDSEPGAVEGSKKFWAKIKKIAEGEELEDVQADDDDDDETEELQETVASLKRKNKKLMAKLRKADDEDDEDDEDDDETEETVAAKRLRNKVKKARKSLSKRADEDDDEDEDDETEELQETVASLKRKNKKLMAKLRKADDEDDEDEDDEEEVSQAEWQAMKKKLSKLVKADEDDEEDDEETEELQETVASLKRKNKKLLAKLRKADDEEDDDDEDDEDDETEELSASYAKLLKQNSKLKKSLLKKKADEDDEDDDEETPETVASLKKKNKKLLAKLRKADENELPQADMSFGEDDDEDDEDDAPATMDPGIDETVIQSKLSNYKNKLRKAMDLVNLERYKGLRDFPMQQVLSQVLQKELNIHPRRAKQIIRRAMIAGMPKDAMDLISEAGKIVHQYDGHDKQFLLYFNRVASSRVADADEMLSNDENESDEVLSWETSNVYNEAPEQLEVSSKSSKKSSQGDLDNIFVVSIGSTN